MDITLILILMICIYWIVTSYKSYKEQMKILKRCTSSTFATIVSVEKKVYKNMGGSLYTRSYRFYPTVQYKVGKKNIVVEALNGTFSNLWVKGKKIEILYNPQNVKELFIPNAEGYKESYGKINFIVSLVGTIIALILYFIFTK